MSTRMTRHVKLFASLLAASVFALSGSVALAQEHGGSTPPAHGTAAPAHGNTAPPKVASPEGHGGEHDTAVGHGEGHGDAHAAAGGHHGPEAINWTDIFDKKKPAFLALVINFGALAALYYILGKKPIAEALKQRRVTIGKDIEEAQKLLEEAQERAKKYQGDLKNADADAATAKAGLVSAGKGEVDRIVSEANERADRMKRDAERLVEQERKQVQQDLLHATIDNAVKEANQLLAKTVTADDHMRLANDLLAELAKRPGAARATSVAPPRSGGAS